MDERSLEFMKKTIEALAALPSLIALGEKAVNLVMEAKDVLDSGQVTDEQWDAQSARIYALRNELHKPD